MPSIKPTRYDYDAQDHLVKVTDAKGRKHAGVPRTGGGKNSGGGPPEREDQRVLVLDPAGNATS